MGLIHIPFRRSAPQTYKPVILVTGCASGIGLALARLLWEKTQYRVVITARESSLERFKKESFIENDRFWIRSMDVNNTVDRKRVVSEIVREWDGVDILINNAGISFRAVVEHMDENAELKQLRTNYLSPMALTRKVLPYMRRRGRGKIINVSSVSGMLAMPTMSSYSASKYALEASSEALWYEMKPLGINVTLVQPGFVNSKSFKNVYYSEQSASSEAIGGPYSDYYRNMVPFIEKMMRRSLSTPESIARKILKVIQTENPPLKVPATFDAIVFHFLRRVIPRRLFHPILYYSLPGARNWADRYSQRRSLFHKKPPSSDS